MNYIEGYRLYLLEKIDQAENQGLSEKKQAELLNAHLPYVIAFDLDGDWMDDMMRSLKQSMSKPEWVYYSSNPINSIWDDDDGWCCSGFTSSICTECSPPSTDMAGGSSSGGSYGGGGGFGGGGGGFSGGSGGGGW